jgi:hypothetical protein
MATIRELQGASRPPSWVRPRQEAARLLQYLPKAGKEGGSLDSRSPASSVSPVEAGVDEFWRGFGQRRLVQQVCRVVLEALQVMSNGADFLSDPPRLLRPNR